MSGDWRSRQVSQGRSTMDSIGGGGCGADGSTDTALLLCRRTGRPAKGVGLLWGFHSASLMSERTEVDGRRTATEGSAVIRLAFQWAMIGQRCLRLGLPGMGHG